MADSEFKRLLQLWHGSPYDWERPDPAKAGAGEGTKAMGGYGIYGHGTLYAAEQQDIGKWYLEQTSKKRRRDASGAGYQIKGAGHRDFGNLLRELEDRERMLGTVEAWREVNQGDPTGLKAYEDTLKTHDYVIDGLIEKHGLDEFKDLLKSLDHHDLNHLDEVHHSLTTDSDSSIEADEALDNSIAWHLRNASKVPNSYTNYGSHQDRRSKLAPLVKEMKRQKSNIKPRLYELQVHLDDHEILDWDNQLEEHHPEAQKKILSVPELKSHTTPPLDVDENTFDTWMNRLKVHPDYAEGADAYKWLADTLGGAPNATKALMAAGIKGIRYEDNSSRDNKKPVLKLDDNVLNHRATHTPGRSEADKKEERYALMLARTTEGMGLTSMEHAAEWYRTEAKKWFDNPGNEVHDPEFQESQDIAEWYDKNKHRLKFEPPPPSYNYVIFDPDRIDVVRKFDKDGNKVYEKK